MMVVELIGDGSESFNATLGSVQVTLNTTSCVQVDYILQGTNVELLVQTTSPEEKAPITKGSFFIVNVDGWDHGQFILEPGSMNLELTAFGKNGDTVILDNIILQEGICNHGKNIVLHAEKNTSDDIFMQ